MLRKWPCSTSPGILNSGKLNQSVTCKFPYLIVKNVSYGLISLKLPLKFTQPLAHSYQTI